MNAVKISIDERNRGDTLLRAEQNYAIDVVKYIMAFCVIAIHTLPLKNVQNEGVTSLFDTFYILLGALIARTRIFAKAKIILPVLVGTFLAAAFLNLSLMKIIMSVMFFMLVLMCNCSGDGRKFRRTSTVMYYTHMIFLFVLNMLCKRSMYGFVGFCFCCFMTNIFAYTLNTNEYCKNNTAVSLLFGSL